MRISTSSIYNANVSMLNQLQARLLHTQQQLSSGRRMLTPADDPIASARALDLSQSDAINTQYATNRNSVKSSAALSENILNSVTSLLQDVRTMAVQAGGGTLTPADKKTIASALTHRLEELQSLANSNDGMGNFLYSGYQGRTQPFANSATGVQYMADDGQRMVQVSSLRQLAASDSGADIFMRIKNGNGTFATQAATANTGSGIASQGLVITPPFNGNSYRLDFSVLAGATTYAVTNTTTGLVVPPSHSYATQAAAANTGTGIASQGVVNDPALLTGLTGNSYRVTFTPDASTFVVTNITTAAVVTVPAGNTYVSGQNIIFDGIRFDISGAPSVNDQFTIVTGTPYVSGQAISFAGIQFDISGAPSGGDKFTVTPSTNESLFKTVSDLITALNTPITPGNVASSAQFTSSLSRALSGLDRGLENVLTVRGSLGSRLAEIDALNTTGEDLGLIFKATLSQLQDLDYNKGISDLNQQQFILTAAQKTFKQVSDLSLFNYL